MQKINIQRLRALVSPSLVVVASAYDEKGTPQACTLSFFTMISHKPPYLIIGINATAKRKTLQAIELNKAFVVSVPSVSQVQIADYLGAASGHDTNKLENLGLSVTKSSFVNAPIINEFPLALECEVVHSVTLGSHVQITAQIKNICGDVGVINEKNRVDLAKLDPLIYDEEGLVYYELGDVVAEAYKTAQKVKKEIKERKASQ